ncbi:MULTISPECIES: phage protein [unclassified Tatumella]|uniref:phage protein n=1 Tax=unclassified Tatumella TaxID=2649542 RepID=UPI001BAE7B8B|nr:MULTISPECIES: phage protein [unclassified Tatumella]MBS0876525.1 DUF2717 domain-containing protein [Tatumella sp. JGM82]MBS0889698.1 DUF2717 domain-containing protein [Tatumella sp. JGM94]MBS0900820.1 DUF2717 domain-containing protein [Tatumella sp. JGM100]
MILDDIKQMFDDENKDPLISKELYEYMGKLFSYEYLQMSGVLDQMRISGYSQEYISGYSKAMFDCQNILSQIYNKEDEE